MSYEKLCPVHRGFIAMSGRTEPSTPGLAASLFFRLGWDAGVLRSSIGRKLGSDRKPGRNSMPQPVAIDTRQSLLLSERDRAVFFDALVHPPKPNTRLLRAFRAAQERVAA